MESNLASGAELNKETFGDFVDRLKYHCIGQGVSNHITADAIFIVQAKRIIAGIDSSYTDKTMVFCDDMSWYSPQEYYDDCDDDDKESLDSRALRQAFYDDDEAVDIKFLDIDEDKQWELLGEIPDHTVTGWDDTWEYVCAHFTKEAAEAFIARKKHDYRLGMRVYVESQNYCWEFNAIKEALINGDIVYKGE